jgi:high affinity Mn2+ porin
MISSFRCAVSAGLCVGELLQFGATAIAEETTDTRDTPASETWSLHGQFTNVTQRNSAFHAPYSGPNSLLPSRVRRETTDVTLYLGRRLWPGGELYLNPEMNQGFGLSETRGVAGFPSGEAYKIGNNRPYYRLQRAFLRQVIRLDGGDDSVEGAANQLAGTRPTNNVTVTLGKFSVVDIFDNNRYAHDPRSDFLNWANIDSGVFDYAANALGYTAGAAIEWNQSWWTLRAGFFDLSDEPNSSGLDGRFRQNEWVGEFEARHRLFGQAGKVKLLGFVNRGDMGRYDDAVLLAQQMGAAPDTSLVRRMARRSGMVVNIEQALAPDLGMFLRAGLNGGSKEAFDFTDINRSVSGGISLKGDRWGRHVDTVGVAVAMHGLSSAARGYFAAGGHGLLVGDGQLRYGTERIAEAYYKWQVHERLAVSVDFQYIVNPAYNRDRGPVSVLGLRAHAEF